MFLWHWLSGSGTGPAPRTRGTSLIFFRRVNPGCPELRPDLRERYPLALVRHVDVRGEPAADLGAQDGAAEANCLKIGLPGKSILRACFQENRVLFHKIGSPGEPHCGSQENHNLTKNVGCSLK